MALRYGIAGTLLLPVFIRRGVADCAGIGWRRGIVLAIMSGVPMALLMNTGLALAPASHGGRHRPGHGHGDRGRRQHRPVRRQALAADRDRDRRRARRTRRPSASPARGPAAASIVVGDLLFFATGLLWGFYPLLLQKWNVGAMTSTAIVSVLSLVYIPVYALLLTPRILAVDPWVVLFHGINQGLLNVILGLWLWGHAVRVLGAATAQRFPPLIPVAGTLLAIPILGEWPPPLQAVGVALIVAGLGLAAFAGRLEAKAK